MNILSADAGSMEGRKKREDLGERHDLTKQRYVCVEQARAREREREREREMLCRPITPVIPFAEQLI